MCDHFANKKRNKNNNIVFLNFLLSSLKTQFVSVDLLRAEALIFLFFNL